MLTNKKRLNDTKIKAPPHQTVFFVIEDHFDRYNGNDFEFMHLILVYRHQTPCA